jgi:hypothetical protein
MQRTKINLLITLKYLYRLINSNELGSTQISL